MSAPKSTRSRTSSVASRNGKGAEALWHIAHERCWSAGIAYVHKTEARRIIVGGKHLFAQKAGADYRGVILDGTKRAIAAEAKSTTKAALDLTEERHGLLPHQRDCLALAHAQGGIALVLLVFRTRLRVRAFVLPWPESARGTRVCRLSDADFTRHEVEPGSPYLKTWGVT